MFLFRKSKVWAVMPSAGSGQRMAQSIPKQYLELQGRPIIELTLATLLSEKRIQQVTVCIAENDEFWAKLDCAVNRKVTTTVGGATRAQSVLNGLLALSKKAKNNDWVLVHDAARPCLSTHLLSSMIDQLFDDKVGGILALPSNDTVKLACDTSDESNQADLRIEKTLNRNQVWYAQTPQMFRYGVLKDALAKAIDSGADVTDEASAVEMSGQKPRLIRGESRNIKITRNEDLEMADLLMTQSNNEKTKITL